MRSKDLLLLVFMIGLLAQCQTTVLGQDRGGKPVAKKVVKEPTLKREKESRGEVEFSDFELTWPSIDTHERAMVTVTGNNVKWTQRFIDGDQPVFNPIEEGFEAGTYSFRVQYTGNEVGQAKQERKAAFKSRREFLKKRLELLRKGDRDGARAALEQANQIRSEQAKKSTFDLSQRRDRKKSDFISQSGKFVILDGGKIEAWDEKKERERSAGKTDNSEKRSEEGHTRRDF